MANARTAYKAWWAQSRREQLIERLSGCCALCGRRRLLEIDHPQGRNWEPRETSQEQRVRIYLREAAKGLIRVLCKKCNARDGGARRYA